MKAARLVPFIPTIIGLIGILLMHLPIFSDFATTNGLVAFLLGVSGMAFAIAFIFTLKPRRPLPIVINIVVCILCMTLAILYFGNHMWDNYTF